MIPREYAGLSPFCRGATHRNAFGLPRRLSLRQRVPFSWLALPHVATAIVEIAILAAPPPGFGSGISRFAY